MQNKLEVLYPDTFYHIYNRANGNEKLFLSDENYHYFLKKFDEYISPICNTYCYCLMPNHFHFLMEIKSEKELVSFFKQKSIFVTTNQNDHFNDITKFKTLGHIISKQFSNFFSCYTQAFNKQQQRKGSLFMKNFKRKKITDQTYLLNLVTYIHYNPLDAKLCNQLNEWKFSSYSSLISKTPTLLKRDELLAWYDDISNFEFVHKTKQFKSDFDCLGD